MYTVIDRTGFQHFTFKWVPGIVLGFSLVWPTFGQTPADKERPRGKSVQAGPAVQEPVADPSTQAALARKAQNPIASMISVPFQNNMNFGIGATDRVQNSFLIQPVIPASLGGGVNLITRVIVPIVRQPIGSDDAKNGLGDINASFFLAPAEAGKVIWGAGPAVQLRTATDDYLGTGKWGAGPTAVALTMQGPWVIGCLVSNVWSFAGDSARSDVNSFTLQYFINYNLQKGWYLSSAPILAANWKALPGQRWTIPFGGGAGKIFHIGSQPFNASVQAFGNAWHPDQGASWTLRLQLTLLFPK
jgi:hypothetical protein